MAKDGSTITEDDIETERRDVRVIVEPELLRAAPALLDEVERLQRLTVWGFDEGFITGSGGSTSRIGDAWAQSNIKKELEK